MSRYLLPCLLLLTAAAGFAQDDEAAYREAMARCEEAKGKGDFATMAAALREALKHGPGDEYAWRSLSWALGHLGQWQDSLALARENVARHGETGWSLEQLAEAQIGASDYAGARATLERISSLPPEAIGTAQGAIDGTRQRLLDLTGQRRYRLRWQVDLGQGGPGQPAARLLMPRFHDPRQDFEFTVHNAVTYRPVSEGPRDFIDVVQKPGEPFTIEATVTIRGFALGHAALEALTSTAVPEALKPCLGPFRHGEVFDPASPLCSRIAAFSRSLTPARTVQNLLNWMRDNMKYADTQNATLDAILAGGQGVCHHYCSTFTALCRAAGVPARVAHGIVLGAEGEFRDNAGSHGWASVYLDPVGWVPVEPLDAGSLALFGRSNYLLTDYANETPEDNHFAYTSIQGFKCDGEVLALEPQP
ncbi:MAG: hypothetical protein HPY69_20800 [Armatimonadetes bacterium]|nr:hypothetical protein [Armatimonadota bacterium]